MGFALTRVACVDVPALALQLVLRAHPEWAADPVVVVEDDRPHAAIVWCNQVARAHRITRGTSFAQAKALSAKLHAEVVSEHVLSGGIDALFESLLPFSPGIEPVLPSPGLFWLDPRGLNLMFGQLEDWAARVHAALQRERYVSAVVVGFMRANALALARVQRGPLVLADAAAEQRLAGRVPLVRLGISPGLARDMALLDIRTVAELRALSAPQLRVRYGEEAARLHDFLSGKAWTPLAPKSPVTPLTLQLEVDPPDDDSTRLLFGIKRVLDDAATRLRAEHQAITALEIELQLERLGARHERIETAAPTLDVPQIVDLLRLRLGNVALPARVEQIAVTLELARVHPRQIAIEHGKKPRDLEAAARAVARLRASFGPEAVTRARLHSAHLPEAGYRFELARDVQLPRVARGASSTNSASGIVDISALGLTAHALAQSPLVRRIYTTPQPLPERPVHEPESWFEQGGAVIAMFGPYRIAGGWWMRRRERDYHFVELQNGELLWIFYDRPRRRWFLHGTVD
jgi:protein ImuB